MTERGKRIAILGGGMASLTTALKLTELGKDYEITIYQQGGRLGGKGASSRRRQVGDRNEEHGLHMLFGFYENTWKILREAYEHPRVTRKIEEAWIPHSLIVMMERFEDGDETHWRSWHSPIRRDAKTTPGIGPPFELDAWGLVWRGGWNLVLWALDELRRRLPMGIDLDAGELGPGLESLDAWIRLADDPERLDTLARQAPGPHARRWQGLLRELCQAIATLARELASLLAQDEAKIERKGLGDRISLLLWPVLQVARELLGLVSTSHHFDLIRRGLLQLDFALTVVYGLAKEGLLEVGSPDLFTLDASDFREWLERHGAHERTRKAPMVQGLYAGAFHSEHRVGAGTTINAWSRAAFYKGAPLYKFTAGMGEQVFAPLYLLLRDRGVKFRFFHRVDRLELSEDRTHVAKVVIEPQLGADFEVDAYDPLETVGDWECWRRHPDPDALPDLWRGHPPDFENWWDPWNSGDEITLESGEHFDELVLGISVGAFPYICEELIADRDNPRFADMVASVVTVQTQGLQLWMSNEKLNPDFDGKSPVVIPFELPFDTWCDMSHVLEVEGGSSAKTLGYLCAPLVDERPPPPRSDTGYPEEQRRRVRANAQLWVEQHATTLWPETAKGRLIAPTKPEFDWELLVPGLPLSTGGVDSQYFTATQHPSDRYVLAVPHSHQKRLRGHESGYENLVMAGDWTRNPLSVGCLESAVMSGILAARAIDTDVEKPIYDFDEEDGPGTQRPNYVLRDGEMLVAPPIGLDATVAVFPLLAEAARLQGLVDRRLNLDGLGLRVPELLGEGRAAVFFYCANMQNQVAAGSMDEHDFGFWVPLVGEGEHFLYTPYLWVDSSAALVGGRTVFGFPKHVGELTMPKQLDERSAFSVRTHVSPVQGGVAAIRQLLDLTPATDAPARSPRAGWASDEVIDELAPFLPVVPPGRDVRGSLPRNVFLKEFPDVAGYEACYQAVTAGRIRIDHFVTWGSLGTGHRLHVLECFSHHIVRELGLETQGRYVSDADKLARDRIDPLFGYWLRFRGVVEPGEELTPRRA